MHGAEFNPVANRVRMVSGQKMVGPPGCKNEHDGECNGNRDHDARA